MTRIVTCTKAAVGPDGSYNIRMLDQRQGEAAEEIELSFTTKAEFDEKMSRCESDFPLVEMMCLAVMTHWRKNNPLSIWPGCRVEFDLTNGINPQIKTLQ